MPTGESLRKTVVSTAAALLLAFSPALATSHQAFAAESAGAQELSPAEMLVKKTTEMQVRRGVLWFSCPEIDGNCCVVPHILHF